MATKKEKFIELTSAMLNTKVLVNVDNISFIKDNETTTRIYMGNLTLDVKEDYNTVKEML